MINAARALVVCAVSSGLLLVPFLMGHAFVRGAALAAEPQKQKEAPAPKETPEEKMAKRFPQTIRTGDLKGLPMLDDGDVTLGRIQSIVRSPDGKIRLIVHYSRWFGWFGRPVAVPIETVAILARQVASVDMKPDAYEKAPTWTAGNETPIPDDEVIRIAVTRR